MISSHSIAGRTKVSNSVSTRSSRHLGLDVLRGATIALMILVNTPGSWSTIYAPFRHASWHGFTLTDLVFPTFLFVVGNAMSFSMKKFRNKSDSAFLTKVLKRSLLIFGIGLFLNAFPFVHRSEGILVLKDLSEMRVMGVLQRIGVAYFLSALIIRYCRLYGSIFLSVVILLGYWGVMYFFGSAQIPYSLEGNAVLKFDLLIFSPKNLWHGFGVPFDPEGLLSTFPAVVNIIGGYLAGLFIQKAVTSIETIWKLLAAGLVMVLLAQIWGLYFPINKALWTSSYVLLTIGWDLMILGVLLFVIEVKSIKGWTYFFEVFGRNPLFIFVMSGVLVMLMNILSIEGSPLKAWLYQKYFLSWLGPYNASLSFALVYVGLMWLLGYTLDKRGVYIKV